MRGALLYGLLPVYPLWMVKLFGLSATVVKLFAAGYLLYCAVMAALWERLLSTKHEGYGIGTQSVRSLVESYGGHCTFLAHETFLSAIATLAIEKTSE